MYAGALTRELRSLAPGHRGRRSRRTRACGRGRGAPRRLSRSGGDRPHRGHSKSAAIVPAPANTREMGAGRAAARPGRDRLSRFQLSIGATRAETGIRVVYYVGPQIWAWRPGRLKTIRRVADRMLVIFPFEEAIYQRGGVPVEFVGHPLVDLAKPSAPRDPFLRGLGLAPQAPTVAILPGQPAQRSQPDSAGSGGGRPEDPLGGCWRAVRDRARALSRRSSVRCGEGAQLVAGGRGGRRH